MKKKLIAAVTSMVMVATLAPATAFASTTAAPVNQTQAEAEAVTAASVDAAIAALPKTVEYGDAVKKNLETIRANYDSLTKNADGQGAVTNIDKLKAVEEVYATAYTSAIATAQKAIDAIPAKLTVDDATKVSSAKEESCLQKISPYS